MSDIEPAWDRFPGYAIDLVPWPGRARVRQGDLVLAESDAALIVKESDHRDQLYLPIDDVAWEHFAESDHHTVCPFKGEADYWSLVGGETREDDVVWTYRRPFPEVAGLAGHVAFYTDRLEVELLEPWSGDDDVVPYRFPVWGSAAELADLLDVREAAAGRFTSPPHPDPPLGTFLDIPPERRPRQVVEGGHLLGQAITAASRTVPDQRVVSASMVFTRAAMFDAPLTLDVDVLRRGRTYSTVETRTVQHDRLCAVGLVLLDIGADDAYRGAASMPDVPGPSDCPVHDFGVTGRDVRVVDGAYDNDPDRVGPPELLVWTRFRERPDGPALHAALLAQSTTHYTIAASMRPHRGVTEAMAHVTLSTGPMKVDIAFHDEVDVTDWHLYENPAVYAGRGHVQGPGRVFAADGRLVASYSVHAMVRASTTDLSKVGGYSTAM
jgi:acyl-CoA thioesterase-2